ncbi:MAG: hypothetical protein DRP95_02230 [Candidatus Latescibacterota bacterium]|nr:MAG: hypothetical protein DRP95_02230 [Candidatus Latescibacterota bacterium]
MNWLRRVVYTGFLLLLPIGHTAGSANSEFFFIFCGDSRFGSDSPKDHPEILEQIVQEVNIRKPAFFLYGGDGPDHNTDDNYKAFKACLDKLRVPYYNVIGNHDIYIKATGGYSRDNHRKFFGRPYYTFEHNGCYFIVLDTAGHGGRPWGVRASSPEQWEWMVGELEANVPKYRHTFVVTHVPPYDAPPKVNHAFTDPQEAREFVKLMAKYGVTAVLCSHEHLYYRTEWEGVPYIISGGAGAVLYAPADRGGFYHYIEVHVGDEVEVRVIPVLRSIAVIPDSARVEVGDTIRFRAVGIDPLGKSVPIAPPISASWSSGDTAIGMVDSSGVFRAVSEGKVEVVVTCGLRSGRAWVCVGETVEKGDAGEETRPFYLRKRDERGFRCPRSHS